MGNLLILKAFYLIQVKTLVLSSVPSRSNSAADTKVAVFLSSQRTVYIHFFGKPDLDWFTLGSKKFCSTKNYLLENFVLYFCSRQGLSYAFTINVNVIKMDFESRSCHHWLQKFFPLKNKFRPVCFPWVFTPSGYLSIINSKDILS